MVTLSNLPPGLPFSNLGSLVTVGSMVPPELSSQGFSSSEAIEALLPRGSYTYNERTEVWDEQPAETGDLTINWVYDGIPSSLRINWELESATAFVVIAVECVDDPLDCKEQVREVSTSLSALLIVGSKEAANLTVRTAYRETQCGYLSYEPTSLSMQGSFGQDTTVTLEADLHVTTGNGLDTAASALVLTAEAGNDSASFRWDWDASGVIARDDHCFPFGAETIVGGNLNLDFHSLIDNKESSFSFVSVVSEVVQNEDGVPKSAQVAGHLDIDRERTVNFVGRLDDENEDGVLGDNMLLTFADGTTTLEVFLRSN